MNTWIVSWKSSNDLVGTTEPVMPHASDKGDGRPEVRSISEAEHLSQKLSQVQDSLKKVKSCERQGSGHVLIRKPRRKTYMV